MKFEKFMEAIKDAIKEYLPESYQDAQVMIQEQRKLNKRYMGLTVTRAGDERIPTINLTDLYRQYNENPQVSITNVLEQISQIIQREPERFDVSRLTQYDEAKKHLFMRVLMQIKMHRYWEAYLLLSGKIWPLRFTLPLRKRKREELLPL